MSKLDKMSLSSLKRKKLKKKHKNGVSSEKRLLVVKKREPESVVAVPLREKSVPAVAVAETPEFVPPAVELHPWTFKRPDKVTIKRENWNSFVGKIQAAACSEAERENEELHHSIRDLLNKNEELRKKYVEMETFVSKFSREFTATYGV